jgi:hypothetical protein
MKVLSQQLIEALDKVSAKGPQAAKRIHEQSCALELKLQACQALLAGTEAAPKWRESAADKLVTEIRESWPAFRPTIVKHNGRLDNIEAAPSGKHTITEVQKKLIVGFKAMGLSEAEARVAAEANETEVTHYQKIMEAEGGDQ